MRHSAPAQLSLPALGCLILLAGCTAIGQPGGDWNATPAPAVAPQPRPDAGAAPAAIAPGGARSAAAFDRSSAADKAAALATPAGGAHLGQVTVSLGNPAEQGFWLRSALVTAARPGTVKLATGATVQVELLPSGGGGTQLSLAAYRALGLGLTDLPSVTVLGR